MSEPINFEPTCRAFTADEAPEFARFVPPGCMVVIDAEGDLVAIVPALLVPDVVPLLNGETIEREGAEREAFHRDHAGAFAAWDMARRG